MSLLVEYIQEFGRFQRNARLYLISNGLSGVTLGIITVLYNLYLLALGYQEDFIGLVLFAGTIGAGIAIFPAGLCVDRVSGKRILIWSSVLIGFAGAGQFLFRQPFLLLASTFIVGIGAAFLLVVNAPFMTSNSTPLERPLLFSLNIVVTLATTVLGELLGGFLPIWLRMLPWLMAPLPSWLAWVLAASSLARSYQLALCVAGLIALPSFVPLFLMHDDRPHVGGHLVAPPGEVALGEPEASRPARGSRGVARLGAGEARRRAVRQLIKILTAIQANLESAHLRNILTSRLFLLVLIQALIGMGAGLFIPYFNIYFVRHLGASSALFGAIDGGANALNAFFTLVAPWLALRMGKVNTIVVTRLLSIPLLLLIGLTSYLPLATVLYPLRQGMMDMSNGIWQVFSMEAVRQERRGLANSSYQAAYQVAWALTVPLGGLIIVHIGYTPIFLGAAILYALATTLLWTRFGRYERDHGAVASKEELGQAEEGNNNDPLISAAQNQEN